MVKNKISLYFPTEHPAPQGGILKGYPAACGGEVHYTPLVSEDEYRKFQTRSFIDRIYDGNVKNLLTALCRADSLSRQDVEELAEFLEKEAGRDG